MDEPVLTKEALLANAAAEDAGRSIDTEPAGREVDDPEPVAEAAAKPKEKPSDKQEKPVVSEENKDKGLSKTDGKQAETDKGKSKWQQNEERKGKTWAEINAEKEAIKAQKQAVEKERQEIIRAKEDLQRAKVTADPIRDEHGYTAKEYRETAAQYRKTGNNDIANAAEKLAANLDTKHQQLLAQRTMEELQQKQRRAYEDMAATKPDLNDTNSELFKELKAILDDRHVFLRYEGGLNDAVALAESNLRLKADDGTKAELSKLKEEHAKLQKKLSIGGGSPTNSPEEDTPFEKLSLAEQRKRLEQTVRASDREQRYDD